MPTAWKRFRTMLGQLLAKFPDRRVRDAQFASHLCNRLPAGLSEPYGFALSYTALGEHDKAFEWLERCAQDRSGQFAAWVNGDPRLDSLRADPRLDALLRRIGLR